MALVKIALLFTMLAYATALGHVRAKRGSSSTNVLSPTIAQLSSLLKETQANLIKLEARLHRVETNHLGFLRGRDGRDGLPGINGRDGHDGQDGMPGPQGPQGPKGSPGKDGQQGPPGRSGGGVLYYRWGRTTCPSGADLVYKGYMGGEHYSHIGGGVNYLCLTRQPKYLNFKPGFQNGGRMYGTEYEVSSYKRILPNNLHDHGAPCAACYVKTRSAKMMIPGTYECPAGWTREYYGYLMTAHYSHNHPSEFICVDENAEAMSGTYPNKDGALLYPVQGACGSLPCKPYIEGYELTCAVCTK